MAFPWIFESNFENTVTPFGWDSESDTGDKLDVAHYSLLSRIPNISMPFRGASCMRVDLRSGDANDHVLVEGDIDIADATTRWFRFYLWLSPDFAATADDTFNIFELQQAGGTVESSLGLRITAATDAVEIGIGDGTAPTDFAAATLSKGVWHCIELQALISTAGAGTLDLYVDGSASLVALTTLTNAAAVGRGVLGTQNQLDTTTGTLLFDQFVMDDLQIYQHRDRFPLAVTLTQSGHVFVGPGVIESATLLTIGASNTMFLYDTDTANVNDAQGRVLELDLSAHTTASDHGSIYFQRGCYVALAGTNPRGQVVMSRNLDGPRYYSEAGMRRYGLMRKNRLAGNV